MLGTSPLFVWLPLSCVNAGSLEDVNGDGFLDLVVQIMDDGSYSAGDTEATLTVNLYAQYGGTPIQGTDSICIVPRE